MNGPDDTLRKTKRPVRLLHRGGQRITGKAQARRDLLEAARSLGWKGRTVAKAKRFGRRLERMERTRKALCDLGGGAA